MVTWSLCMIVRNEETVLKRCLESAGGLFDQIVIVDTGSTDRTKAIAGEFAAEVYDFRWIDDFAAARNYSFSKAKSAYIMWLDADDVLPRGSYNRLLEEKKHFDSAADVIMLSYQTAFDEQGNPVFQFERERIVRNDPRSLWVGAVHEAIVPYGKIRHIDAPVQHRKIGEGDRNRNLRIYEKMIAEGKTLTGRHMYYYGRELLTHGRIDQAEKTFLAFLSGENGWLEDRLDAARQLAFCRYRQGNDKGALQALLSALELSAPRAELCCDLGRHFFDRGCYETAVFWYKTALSLSPGEGHRQGFRQTDCYGFLPCIQLCLCYDRLGKKEQAAFYNEKAGALKPDSVYYLHNKKYFSALDSGKQQRQ